MDFNKGMKIGNDFPKGMKKAYDAYPNNPNKTKEGMVKVINCNAVGVEKMDGFYSVPKAGKVDMKVNKVEKPYK